MRRAFFVARQNQDKNCGLCQRFYLQDSPNFGAVSTAVASPMCYLFGQKNWAISKKANCGVSLPNLTGENTAQIVQEMLQRLYDVGEIAQMQTPLEAVLAREATASTALGNFSCFPHAKIEGIDSGVVAVGISQREIEAGSMDGRPTKIFILILSSNKKSSPHIQLMTQLAQKVDSLEKAEKILSLKNEEEIYRYFTK